MSLLTADDLERMLEDTGGKSVTLGAEATIGQFDNIQVESLDPSQLEVREKQLSLLIPAGKLPSLARGVTLIYDGTTNYRVRDFEPDDPAGLGVRVMVVEE